MNELRAYAIEFPFNEPVIDWAELFWKSRKRRLKRMREKERIRLATQRPPVFVRFGWRDERDEILRLRRPVRLRVAHHPLRDELDVKLRRLGDRLSHLQLRDADAQFAGDELKEWQAVVGRHGVEPLAQRREPLSVIALTQGQ